MTLRIDKSVISRYSAALKLKIGGGALFYFIALGQRMQASNVSEIASGKWLRFKCNEFKDPKGRLCQWEYVERAAHQDGLPDAVEICAILKQEGRADRIILVTQYRPALQAFTLEFPAGLIDPGEDAAEAARRELLEETGYRLDAAIQRSTHKQAYEPGLTNSTLVMVYGVVDGNEECNQLPSPTLEPDEWSLQTVLLPLECGLSQAIDDFLLKNPGTLIDAKLETFALGWSFGMGAD